MDSSGDDRNPVEALAEEFLARQRRGERPSVTEYAERHPDLAAEIRDLFPALVLMEDLGGDSGAPTGPFTAAAGGCDLTQLGDYRILREVGRGGMGVVYEAEQESLGRRVALKVLPAHTLLNPKQVQRFEREARAAARLHHTNIVPVFGVGAQDGLHYYVMQFIAGQGLDLVIDQLRRLRTPGGSVPAGEPEARPAADIARSLLTGEFTAGNSAPDAAPEPREAPAPADSSSVNLPGHAAGSGVSSSDRQYWRSVARIGIQVAEALEYAHHQGVLHRDIKPSNLLLDVQGNVWVTDFGLAKVADSADLTHTGDVVGTLRYMAPERFAGRGDARSDVYSLGLTLYELAALRPAFAESDRHRLMQQVTQGEPPRLRKVSPAVPRDLETIIHKAAAREPGQRYASAEALAEDLRRFVEDKPILARPAGPLEQCWRWSRRNPAVAALTTAVALALLVGTAVSSYFAVLAGGRADAVLAEKDRADAAAATATQEARRANAQAAEATARTDEARRNLYLARMNAAELAWEKGSVEAVQGLLAQYDGPAEGRDYRNWEWHFQNNLCHEDLRTLRGHTGPVEVVAFSPDGTRLASAGEDKTVRIWDVATGRLEQTLGGHELTITCVTFSPDGTRLASGSRDNSVKVWDVATGRREANLVGHLYGVLGVVFSRDGRRVLSAAADRQVKVWDLTTGKVTRTLSEKDVVTNVAFSPDGLYVALAHRLGPIHVWRTDTGRRVQTIANDDWITAMAFGPTFLAVAEGNGKIRIWLPSSDKELWTLPGQGRLVASLAFGPDSLRLAFGGVDKAVRLWDFTARMESVVSLAGHAAGVLAVAFSPDGTRLASAGMDNTVKVWAALPGRTTRVLGGRGTFTRRPVFNPASTQLVSVDREGEVNVWDSVTGQPLHTLQTNPDGNRVAVFSPDGKYLAAVGLEWDVEVRNATDGSLLRTIECPRGVSHLAFSPDGLRLALAYVQGGKAEVWDLAAGKVQHGSPKVPDIIRLAFSPEGNRLALATRDGAVRIWDLASGRITHTLTSAGRSLSVWEFRNAFLGGPDIHAVLAFSPDGRRLVSALVSGSLMVWDLATGHLLHTLTGHVAEVRDLAFSPDGSRLASAGKDMVVKVWDVETGQAMRTLTGHTRFLSGVVFSPDGNWLASVDEQSTLRLWDARPLTPGVRTEREAVGLIEYYLKKPLLKSEVAERLAGQKGITEEVRREALLLLDRYHDKPEPLNRAGWVMVSQPKGRPADYQAALRRAAAVCRLAPDDWKYGTTLGAAQYRCGQYRAALETLNRSRNLFLRSPESGAINDLGGLLLSPWVVPAVAGHTYEQPANLAFLAMTHYQLGQKAEARATLARLREVMAVGDQSKDADAQALLREAEMLVKD